MNMDTRSISLFSGAMGLDIGLMQAGIDIRIGQDVDASCIQTMQANGHRGIAGDIRQITSEEILQKADMKAGEPFLICGGRVNRSPLRGKDLASMTLGAAYSKNLSV